LALDEEVGMAEETFTIGSEVTCSDGPCGEVRRVVVDAPARALTHLVVEPKHRSGLGRLVPLDLVESDTEAEGVRLRCTLAEFDALPAAEETDFLPGGSGYKDYEAHEAYYWPYFGLEGGSDPLVANASGVVTHDRLPPGEVGVRRGARVHATDGEIGQVEGLVVEPAGGHVTHVLLQEGHLWGRKQVAIPIEAVTKIDEDVSVAMAKKEIEQLPPVEISTAAGSS
jgi:sporulation protein YlmC with PRC-barrel domain